MQFLFLKGGANRRQGGYRFDTDNHSEDTAYLEISKEFVTLKFIRKESTSLLGKRNTCL